MSNIDDILLEGIEMNVFFGAGRIGRKALTFWKDCGLVVDFFADNNSELWGKKIEGIEVIPPTKLTCLPIDTNIMLTCKDMESISLQLKKLGIQEHRLKKYNNMLLPILSLDMNRLPLELSKSVVTSPSGVLFCLDSGLTLGGVELFSLNTAKKLRALGWKTGLLLNCETLPDLREFEDEYMIKAVFPEGTTEWGKLSYLISSMLGYRNIICNFAGYNLIAACLIKKAFPMRYNVIAVIHNDEERYYQNYMEAEPYINCCINISSKMRMEMLKRGFPEQKLTYLPWNISCSEVSAGRYSQKNEPIRIGYAGRIVVLQKRADKLPIIAKKLQQRGVNFRLEIAGTGSYKGELERQIREMGLQNEMYCSGVLKDISSFWSRQDIMVSCSEFEGHSISQCEAMAAGAVPVITDTSGARDDVEDGENGFVVRIGDIDQIVERICFLYWQREQIPVLGARANETIIKRNQKFDFQKLWESILLS